MPPLARTNRLAGARRCLVLLFGLCVTLVGAGLPAGSTSAAADKPSMGDLPLEHVVDIRLPGRTTRLDYESYDPTRHLLFIAHLGDGEVIVFDVASSRVLGRLGDVSSVHGVLVVPAQSRVYASATGTNEIVAIDEATLKIVARIPGGRYPDGMAYATDAHKLYVSDETGETETAIDTQTERRVATIPLGGEVGNSQYDPISRHIFVNVQTRNELVEIDPAIDRVISRFPLTGAKGNHGLLIDAQDRIAFIACEGNDKLLVFDMGSRRVLQSFDVGSAPDVLAFDTASRTLYVAGEAGVVSMFSVKGAEVKKIGEGRVGPNAHVVAVDPATHRAYFPLKNVDGHPVLRVMEAR